MFKLAHVTQILRPKFGAVFKSANLEFHTTSSTLAGHSKWANIKHVKGLKDGQRANEFSRLSRLIRLAVQDGGGSTNPDLNSSLRVAVQQALKRNMPNATIQGVLKKCSTQSTKLNRHLLEIRHGFKVFMIVVLYTESLANSKMYVAALLKKSGSSYDKTAHMFFDKGILEVVGNDKLNTKTADELEEIATEHAIESGAEEFEIIDEKTKHLTFTCDSVELDRVNQKISAFGYNVEVVEQVFIPNNPVTLSQAEHESYEKFKEKLKAFDGVDAIYDNVLNDIEN